MIIRDFYQILDIGGIYVHFYFFGHFISGDKMTHIRFIGDLFRMVKFEVYKFRASPRLSRIEGEHPEPFLRKSDGMVAQPQPISMICSGAWTLEIDRTRSTMLLAISGVTKSQSR